MTIDLSGYKTKKQERAVSGKPRKVTLYAIPCPNPGCQETRWLTPSDARKAIQTESVCKICSCRAKGVKGFEAVKNDPALRAKAYKNIQAYRKAKTPSNIEQAFMDWMQRVSLQFEREALINHFDEYYLVDFALDRNVIVEIDGYWHYNDPRRNRAASDQHKRESLKALGFQVLTFTESDIQTGAYEQAVMMAGIVW